ncbi:PCC domain-containing protein [Prochlorococcus marinus]|uniref:PCC domain-containing protein n=1 Tax=Prochlorococcus marinus TaxID=1219 RepID=UPI0022B38046|nr:DUF296 domain-containing protein [Prochlorococcus marinus]
METHSLRLSPGDDLKTSVLSFAKNNDCSGHIIGVIGDLSKAAIQCPGKKSPTIFEEILEVITLIGTISPDKVHLHISFSDGDCKVWGGHLEEGAIIYKGLDLLIGIPNDYNFQRKPPQFNKNSFVLEIATLPKCPWSSRLLRMLKSTNLTYNIIEVNDDDKFIEISKRSDSSTFPQVFIDNNFIGGYEEFKELYSSGKFS